LIGAFGSISSDRTYIFQKDSSGNWIQQAKLTASDGVDSDQFGYSVSLSGDTALIGAISDDDLGDSSGSAYFFILGPDTDGDGIIDDSDSDDDGDGLPDAYENLHAFLDPLNSADALLDQDGDGFDNLSEYHAVTDPDNASENPGTSAIHKVVSNGGQAGDFFGLSVSIDDDTALVGANFADGIIDGSGAAYIYLHDGSGNWIQQAKLIALDGATDDDFGRSVSLSQIDVSGNWVALVGARADDDNGTDSGSAYVFQNDGSGNWVQLAKLVASDPEMNDHFGFSVAISQYDALQNWTAIVGSLLDDDKGSNSGSAYIFNIESSGNWTQQTKLTASDGVSDDLFGHSVSIHQSDASGNWSNTAIVGAVSGDGNSTDSGSAYIFQSDGSGNWVQQSKLQATDGAAGDQFGYSVSLSDDLALVGTLFDDDNGTDSGSAYVFHTDGSGNWTQQAKLTAADGAADDLFGSSVSLYENTALIGAPADDDKGTDSGSMYIFQSDGSTNWTQQSKVTATDGAAGDSFGTSVSLTQLDASGNWTALAGAITDDDNGADSGSAYFFTLNIDAVDTDGDGTPDSYARHLIE